MSTAAPVPQSSQARCIHGILEAWAELTPEAIAIAAPGRVPLTYHRLLTHVKSATGALNSAGIGRNDRVIVVLPNGPEMATAFLAVAAGATCAPLNPAYRANELASYMTSLDGRALIVQAEMDSPAKAVAQSLGIPILELSSDPEAEAGLFTLGGVGHSHAARSGFAEPGDVALVMQTSGTTSRPKIVSLSQSNLCVSADNIRAALELAEGDRCLNVMPLFHIHGLIGAVLSSLAAGAGVVCAPGFYAPQFFEWLEEFRPNWYTAAPTMHQAVLARAAANREIIARSALRFIRSCSAPLPPQLSADLEKTFGVPMIDSYGMTEAGHQIASNPLRRRKAGSVGVAAGPEVAIMDESGHRLSAGQTGEIVIRGANVIQGYDGANESDRRSFIHGWLRTGDLGYLDGDGYLFITGRSKEIINRGGQKISPAELEEALLAHPAVNQAVVFAAPHFQLGEEIAAAVVLHDGTHVSAGELRRFAAQRLADFKVPSRVVFVTAIPTGPTGKVERLRLAGQLELLPEPTDERAAHVAPRTPIEQQLSELWSRVLGARRVGIHDNFFALGGDSILAAQLLSRIRAVLRVELSFVSFFETPTIAGIAPLMESAKQAAPAPQSMALSRAPRGETPPLSYGQERMWFLDQLEPGSPAYNCPACYCLNGPLGTSALERCLTEIIKRHEVLRTTFSSAHGQPLQVVSPSQSLTLHLVDLKKLPKAERRAEAERLAAAEAKQPFDLEKGPLLRATLVRLSEEEHILLLVIHHIVFDGWSEAILLRELAALYDAFCHGRPSSLPPPPLQYADFAVRQRQWLQGRLLQDQLSYWKKQLAAVPVLDLPSDLPRPAVQTFRGARQFLNLPKILCDKLKALGRCEGTTLFMTLLAAFQTLLHRYTGQDDIAVGSPIAGRNRVELEELIGLFINTLVFRGDLSGNPSFRELMARTRKTALEAYEHQELPFEKLVEELRPDRDPGRNPLFQVMFVLENTPRAAQELSGLTLNRVEIDSETAKFDLTLSMEEATGSLKATLEYNTDVFEHDTISRMLGHFETLLQGVAANPEQRLSELPILTEAERRQLLFEWNDAKRDYPRDKCIHELFEEQVERTPNAIAIVFEDRRLTYRELNRRANRLAHHLRKLGVKPDGLIGVYMERSVEMIVALLAVLKAGGAYAPLDPSYPRQRLEFMLQDACISMLLTQHSLAGELPIKPSHGICLDSGWQIVAGESDANPPRGAEPDHLAYVLYTSGSTGKPKGVEVPHRALANLLRAIREQPGLTSDDVLLSVTTFSFDIAALEIFLPLTVGARVVMANREVAADGGRLLEQIAKSRATVMQATPATWGLLLKAGWRGEQRLKILCGGEPLTRELADRLLARGSSLWNLYGPTESTVYSTLCRVEPSDRPIAIGRPIANTEIYLLDSRLQPVPIGVPGELYIGGLGVARGYLNRPELTAEKFIADPFGGVPGARLYKTGDLARYLPDGNIEFLGRLDNQIKIRGFRVELGEIESALSQHPAVRDGVVLAREDHPGNKQLVAYVVSSAAEACSASELREFLKAGLPDYMVPSAFVVLDDLPLGPNGKIDRRALPAPDQGRPELDSVFVAPRSPIEERLANIWAQVLGLERVGVRDNFLDLGGHSLLATQVISRVREAYGVELSLRSFFKSPTVTGIAEIVRQDENSRPENPAPKISRLPRRKIAGERAQEAEDPGRALRSVSLPAPDEVYRVPTGWNDTKRNYPTDKRIHELFEEQAEKTPDAVAAVFEDQRLTYRELNRRVNQLAHYLKKSGVGPEALVGICVERSLEMMVGLLGILKAGGAYVALNPDYPGERLAFMLAETRCDILLTRQALRDRFPAFTGRALCLDRDRGFWEKEKESNPAAAGAPDDLAYVMYTSGSTGRPKGVLVPHRGVVNYFFYLRETFNLDGADTVLQLAPFSFDASVRDLLGPLTAGARVIILNDFDARDPSAIVAKIGARRVTCLLSLMPTMVNALLEPAGQCPGFDSLRLILVSGEALSGSSCRRAQEAFGRHVQIVNQYGPTETTMTCSYHRIVEADYERGVVPLGKPIPNVRLYILDEHLNPAPTGVQGELHVGGIGVARGYLESPDLNAEKFISDPFVEEPGARLYKTGDLARYLPDGNIEFLGRLDNQVKIRGSRVELEEIEAVLGQHPDVREAVVIAREEVENPKPKIQNPKSGGKRLVAYVVASQEPAPTTSDLRGFLQQKLPDYMVPSAFVMLAALPLTPNGKVNRFALPFPDQGRPKLKSPFVAPRSSIEETLASIWAQVLGLERVGVHDNFFDLGGHSLLATRVISRVREACRVELSLRSFFETPTVAGIADAIRQAKESGAHSPIPRIPRVPRQPLNE